MARHRHLTRAPITEAVIDLRLQGEIALESVINRPQLVEFGYIITEPMHEFEAQINVEEGRALPAATRARKVGLQYRSSDNTQVVQMRVNGFSFHRLEPYTSWEQIFPEAQKLWDLYYSDAGKDLTVGRIAVRFVNRLRLPGQVSGLGDYLAEAPRVPEALPQSVKGFLTRVTIQQAETEVSALITQALEPSASSSPQLSVLLDIDTFKEGSFEPQDPSILDVLGHLRTFKNDIFFESITERTVELFA